MSAQSETRAASGPDDAAPEAPAALEAAPTPVAAPAPAPPARAVVGTPEPVPETRKFVRKLESGRYAALEAGADTDRSPQPEGSGRGLPSPGKSPNAPGFEGERTLTYDKAGLDSSGEPVAGTGSATSARLEKAFETIRAEVRAARARADEADRRAKDERDRAARLDGEKREAGDERDQLRGELERLRESDAELKKLRAVIDVLRTERDDLKAERDKLRGERDLARQAIDEGAVEFEAMQKRLGELEARVISEGEATSRRTKEAVDRAQETLLRLEQAELARAKAESHAKDLAQALEHASTTRQSTERAAAQVKADAEGREKDVKALLAASLTRKGIERVMAHAPKGSWLEALLQKVASDGSLPAGGLFGGGFQ